MHKSSYRVMMPQPAILLVFFTWTKSWRRNWVLGRVSAQQVRERC